MIKEIKQKLVFLFIGYSTDESRKCFDFLLKQNKNHNNINCTMVQRFYFDTAIWRDYYENRSDKIRSLGEWALSLINDIIENNNCILYSDFVVKELRIKYSKQEIYEIFSVLSDDIL